MTAKTTVKTTVKATSQTPVLSARDIRVHIRTPQAIVKAVDGVDIDVFPGECVGLVGESGSGKSTFGRAVTRLLPPIDFSERSGEARFGALDLVSLPEKQLLKERTRGGIAMVFQDPLTYLNPTKSVGAQMAEALPALRGKAVFRRIAELFGQVGLTRPDRLVKLYPHELSGGMRQRVLIAMALALEPKMLVADEPTSALDVTVQMQVIETLRKLNRERNLSLLVITHDLGLVAELCDRVYVMTQGKIVESGEVATLFASPQHPYTERLVNAAKLLHNRLPTQAAVNPAVAASQPLMSARGLAKSFRQRGLLNFGRPQTFAVSDANLDFVDGETLAIVGESGSGKSTLARMLLGLSVPTSGEVLYRGQKLHTMSGADKLAFRRHVQPVFQDPASSLNPRMPISTIIGSVLALHRIVPQERIAARTAELLEGVALTPSSAFMQRYPHQLSGGQQQRVAIARAMAVEPKLMIADEPLSSLDMSVQAQILELLVSLKTRYGLGLILITHDLNLVEAVADRVIVMHQGKMVESGAVAEVFASPAQDYTKLLLASKLSIEPRGTRATAEVTS